jgi:uncharacterized membrane protein
MAVLSMISKLKVEAKVWAATAATFGVSILISVLNAVQADHDLLGPVPATDQTLILIIAPTVVTFLGGYLAKHTPRASTDS